MSQNGNEPRIQKVVIAGATGTIGMSLLSELVNRGIEVTVISRQHSKRRMNIDSGEVVSIVECDFDDLERLIGTLEPDYDIFYYLAWSGSAAEDRNNIELQLKNIQYVLSAVKLAKALGCKKFIGTGSQAEYGNVEGKMSPDTPTNPQYAYGAVKLCAGSLSRIACEEYGIEHIWARILSVYGPYQSRDSVLRASIETILKGKSLNYTKAEQVWDYMYSADAARALYLLAEKGISQKVYCIGSGTTKKLSEYLEILRDEINPDISLRFGVLPYREHQVMHLEADIEELIKDTGFYPEYTFEEGIRETIQWVRSINYE